jgi:hypothetical protein
VYPPIYTAPAGLSVSPTNLNFGNVGLGYRAKRVVTLENQGIDRWRSVP